MIQIKNISKKYVTGGLTQIALDDVSLNLRDNEFVAILGPSGSGKTTLLNIIGGLDRYDSGDIIINNVSTKNYKDKDWDSYRNHTIGFVFQSYNLIPHQTILSNVELALTISGISKGERKKRALDALGKVGLKEQAHKKPSQLSGGQMQRVAIARALVNNPDIVLADEPTGALDTKTSVDVMDLLKEVAKDRLVVMVTHNPELAEEYATRIVNLKDGVIRSDTNPVEIKEEEAHEKIESKNFGKAKMNFLTALSLSFHNLLTKKGRTILTSFAGSIGIIGIALILSLSQGFQNYIDDIQEDTLTSYPLTINKETADFSASILSMVSDSKNKDKKPTGKVKEKLYLSDMANSIGINDLKSFKADLDSNKEEVNKDVKRIKYSYSIQPQIYTIDVTNSVTKLNPSSLATSVYSSSMTNMMSSNSMGSTFFEVSGDTKALEKKYKVLSGKLPEKYNEVMIVLKEPNSITDFLVYSLGLRDQKELKSMMTAIMSGKKPEVNNKEKTFTYEDLKDIKLKLINSSELYKRNDTYNIYEDMQEDSNYMRDLYNKSENLDIVGIVTYKEDDNMNASGVAYTTDLVEHVIENAKESDIVKKQLESKETDVFSGKSFKEANEKSKANLDFSSMISVDQNAIASAFKMPPMNNIKVNTAGEEQIKQIVTATAQEYSQKLLSGANAMELSAAFINLNKAVLSASVEGYESAATFGDQVNLKGTDMAIEKITGAMYKEIIQKIAAMDPSYASITTMSSMLSDDDFNKLAGSVQAMLRDYYGKLKDEQYGYDSNTGFIKVSGTGENKVYGEGATISQSDLVRIVSTNDYASANLTSIINGIVNNYTMYMMAAAIGKATGQAVAPMASSMQSLAQSLSSLGSNMSIDKEKLASAFKFNMNEDQLKRIMESMYTGNTEKSIDSNLISLGYQDLNDPTSISFFFTSFDKKDHFKKYIDNYNDNVEKKSKKIEYTDMTAILMSSVQTIVSSVSYVLIAFVSVSLIVSSIMIAVITLISVMERRKEIGILRAMGASKRNVSSIFNAETFIIGLLSGLTGVGVTLFFVPIINSIIHNVTGNYKINAVLPVNYAITLILIAVFLTMIAGFFPSKKASKNDPVVALRSE